MINTRAAVRREISGSFERSFRFFYPNLTSRFDFWPVETAVIGIAFDPDERPSAPDALVNIVVRVLALVLDRQHVRRQTHGSDE